MSAVLSNLTYFDRQNILADCGFASAYDCKGNIVTVGGEHATYENWHDFVKDMYCELGSRAFCLMTDSNHKQIIADLYSNKTNHYWLDTYAKYFGAVMPKEAQHA